MSKHGFTLLEVLIVLITIALLGSFGLVLSLGAHRQTVFEKNFELLVTQLYQTRAAAMYNKNGSAHGVRIEPGKLIVFTGSGYDPAATNNTYIPFGLSLANSSDVNIIFQPLSGEVKSPATIKLTDGLKVAEITINEEGAIIE